MGLGTAATVGIIGAAGAVGSAAISANAAGSAANKQVAAANQALTLQEPYINAGAGAATQLSSLLAPGGDLTKPWTGTFTAPTAAEAEATPGYQFQLQQGQQALQRSAAARGGLLSGGTAKALDQYSQGLASQNYQQTYNNALTQYQSAYQTFQQNQQNQYSRLLGLAQVGQGSAANAGNILQGQGAAAASGTVGTANAITGGISGAANSASNAVLLQTLLNRPALPGSSTGYSSLGAAG